MNLLLAILLSVAAPSDRACHTVMLTVCPIHKPKHKAHPHIVLPSRTVVVEEVPVPIEQPTVFVPPPFPLQFGVRGAVGLATIDPHVAGEVGLRLHLMPAHLALDGYTDFHYGYGVQLLGYPVQGEHFLWHINAGVLFPVYGAYLDVVDINRTWDLTAGTGIEIPILRWLAFTADYRLNFADPAYINTHVTPATNSAGAICYAPYISPGHYVGNTFLGSRVWIGLMVHTW